MTQLEYCSMLIKLKLLLQTANQQLAIGSYRDQLNEHACSLCTYAYMHNEGS